MPLSGIELSAGIIVGSNKPIDSKYGPHASTTAALADIGAALRHKGLTVGIETAGQVVEYWFRDGVADGDLVEKAPPLEIENITGLTSALDGKQIKTVYSDAAPAHSPGLEWVDTTNLRSYRSYSGLWVEIDRA